MGSHATCSGAWASGPEDYAPAEYQWGYNRMMTIDGLFGAGDTIGGGLELLAMMKEDMSHMGAEDLHQLQRVWELHHRLLASESVTRHTLFREETRWPGYYYRGDHMKLDDENWHVFTLSRYDAKSGNWEMEKAPVYHIID